MEIILFLPLMKGLFTLYCLFFVAFFGLSQDWKKELNSARKLYKEGNYPASVKKYRSAQKLAPKDIDLSDELGQASYKANEFTKAEKNFNQSSSKKGNASQQAKTYHNIGNAKMKQKKYAEAVESYKEALRKNPNDNETRYNLSQAMKQQKKEQEQQQKKQQNQNQQKKDPPKDKKDQEDKKDKEDKQNPKDDQQNQPQNQQRKQNQNQDNSKADQSPKLSDKKTERMLDELQKKEMETKKKLDKNKGKSSKKTTGKDW